MASSFARLRLWADVSNTTVLPRSFLPALFSSLRRQLALAGAIASLVGGAGHFAGLKFVRDLALMLAFFVLHDAYSRFMILLVGLAADSDKCHLLPSVFGGVWNGGGIAWNDAGCLADYWGSFWNRPVATMLKEAVYVPLRAAGVPVHAAGILTFAVSGLNHLVRLLGGEEGRLVYNKDTGGGLVR